MGMQIPSLFMGDYLSQSRELPRENRPPIPGSQKFSPDQAEIQLGGNRSETPDLEKISSNLEQISLAFNRRLKFEINADSREVIVKVIDNATDKVIRELPPEELQRLHSRIREIGVLFDRKV